MEAGCGVWGVYVAAKWQGTTSGTAARQSCKKNEKAVQNSQAIASQVVGVEVDSVSKIVWGSCRWKQKYKLVRWWRRKRPGTSEWRGCCALDAQTRQQHTDTSAKPHIHTVVRACE